MAGGTGWTFQGQHIECKDGGRREAGVQTRILLLVGWFLSAIDPPYRRNERNGTFARILRRVGTSIYPLDGANLTTGRTRALNDIIHFPRPTQYENIDTVFEGLYS